LFPIRLDKLGEIARLFGHARHLAGSNVVLWTACCRLPLRDDGNVSRPIRIPSAQSLAALTRRDRTLELKLSPLR
jgi:hypothetical protein